MKANVQLLIFGIVLSMVSVGQLKAQLNFTSAATVTIDFSTTIAGVNNGTYAGTGLAPSPAVGQLDSDGLTITGIGNTTGGSISSNFFILPPPDALFAVTAGVDTWFGMSPLGDWSIVLQVDNNIPGTSIYSFDVDFQMLFRNLSPADQTYKLEYAPSPTGPWTQFGGTIELPPASRPILFGCHSLLGRVLYAQERLPVVLPFTSGSPGPVLLRMPLLLIR
jgi:hypothetical protein